MTTYDSPLTDLLQQRRIRALIYLAMMGMVLLSGIFIVLTANGYGTLRLQGIPAAATVSLNGHTATTTSLKLRPGNYQLLITSPTTAPYVVNLSVSLWHQTVYEPTLQLRSADAIARSLLGTIPHTAIAPQVSNLRWFDSNTWFVGTLAPADTVLVAHYDTNQKKWAVALCNAEGYPNDSSNLPPDIASYTQPLLVGGE